MNRRLTTLIPLAALLLCAGFLGTASATNTFEVTITVPPDTLPDDAHLIFQNTGGIKGVESKDPDILSIAVGGAGNQVDLTFVGKLAAGTQVTFNFQSSFAGEPQPKFNSGTWTNNSVVLGPISPNSVAMGHKVPGASTVGLIVLSALTLAAGAVLLGRRRTAVA